jgi:hypothetical protein
MIEKIVGDPVSSATLRVDCSPTQHNQTNSDATR